MSWRPPKRSSTEGPDPAEGVPDVRAAVHPGPEGPELPPMVPGAPISDPDLELTGPASAVTRAARLVAWRLAERLQRLRAVGVELATHHPALAVLHQMQEGASKPPLPVGALCLMITLSPASMNSDGSTLKLDQ